ncbi:MAG: hypothetical protein GC155_14380 [Alphaproteobacteria bacterium]|nr:hypothetical protein [Alphaproteobacteria bacterium]
MKRIAWIAGGLALAAMAAGCASTPAAEKPMPAAPAAAASTTPALPAAVAAAQGPGEEIFNSHCIGCHGSGVRGAPAVSVLAEKQASEVVAALTTGKMKGMGASLSDEDKANVAMFLTKKPI